MKPILPPLDFPKNIETDFAVDWENLITSAVDLDLENGMEYLMEIKKYSNNGEPTYGIIAKKFEYKEDAGFEKLLTLFAEYYPGILQRIFIPALFTKTAILNHLQEVYSVQEELKGQLEEAKFQQLDCFKIESELSSYLYYYGMYGHFYENNKPSRANEITRDFTKLLYTSDLDNVECFTTRLP
ncbi:MAG TPA: hypothetical protein VK808_09545 [Bacteroidia bacterium]|nr:hypothetical protein [Bacteroidia bacterium]